MALEYMGLDEVSLSGAPDKQELIACEPTKQQQVIIERT